MRQVVGPLFPSLTTTGTVTEKKWEDGHLVAQSVTQTNDPAVAKRFSVFEHGIVLLMCLVDAHTDDAHTPKPLEMHDLVLPPHSSNILNTLVAFLEIQVCVYRHFCDDCGSWTRLIP
jgi:hypothetical protein